jgi:hypothetical protein
LPGEKGLWYSEVDTPNAAGKSNERQENLMTDTIQKTKSTSKPRKTTAKKETVAEVALAAPSHEEAAPVAKAAIATKAKAAPKPRKAATKIEQVAAPAKARQLSRAEIEQVAYRYWAERGYQHGNALQDWLRAEQELLKKAS